MAESKPEKDQSWYLEKVLRPFLIALLISTVVQFAILLGVCISQSGTNPKVWNLLLVPPASLALGNLVGFLFATIGREEKRFAGPFAAINALLGGAILTDVARGANESVVRGFFQSLGAACGLEGAGAGGASGSAIVVVLIIGFFGIGFLALYIAKVSVLNPLVRLQDPDWLKDPEVADAVKAQGVGGKYEAGTGEGRESGAAESAGGSGASAADGAAGETGHAGEAEAGAPGEAVPAAPPAERTTRDVRVMPAENLDPQKGRWGGQSRANGRELVAEVHAVEGRDEWFKVRLTVRSTDSTKPLSGSVQFHLHPTFRNPNPVVEVEGGEAELLLVAWGAFTVGAVADQGVTQLELDLARLPGVPNQFSGR